MDWLDYCLAGVFVVLLFMFLDWVWSGPGAQWHDHD